MFRSAILAALASGMVLAAPDEPKKPTPKFTLAKDTTFVTEPLDAEGYIDYEAALNKQLKGTSTPETNAVVLLVKCFGPKPDGKELHPDFYKALGIEPPPAEGEYLKVQEAFFQVKRGDENFLALGKLAEGLRLRAWKPADSPRHAEWLKVNEKALALSIEASNRKDYFHPFISRKADGSKGMLLGALLSLVQKNREVAAMLSLRATLKLGEGNIESALDDVLAIHRLCRLTARGGSLIELLVGCALENIAHNAEVVVLNHKDCTAKQAMAFQSELLKLATMPRVADKIGQSERLVFLDSLQLVQRQGMAEFQKGLGNDPGGADSLVADLVMKAVDWEVVFRFANSWYDKIEALLRKPTYAERVLAGEAMVKELRAMKAEVQDMKEIQKLVRDAKDLDKIRAVVSEKIGKVFVSLMLPAFNKVDAACDRAEQFHRNGVIAAGLAAHFADHKTYPDKLADLTPMYLAKVPDDVFSGKGLIYQRTDAGYLFYSVGFNGQDDGGKFFGATPPGDDIGVRMPRN